MKVTTSNPPAVRPQRVSPLAFAEPDPHEAVSKQLVANIAEALAAFENPAKKEDRLVISGMPINIYVMAEIAAARAGIKRGDDRHPISMNTTFAFLYRKGLAQLQLIPGVTAISDARASVIAWGDSDSVAWFDDFPLVIPCGHSGRRPVWAKVCEEDRTKGSTLARSLGLTASTVAILAVSTVLVDLDDLSFNDNDFLQRVIDDFARRVKARAREATHRMFHRGDDAPPTTDRRRTFAEILVAIDEPRR